MAAGNVGFGDDPLAPGCYSQLLFAEENPGLETDGLFGLTSSFSSDDTPKMLCFGDYAKQYNENPKKTGQKPGSTCMASSSLSSRKNINNKRNGSGIRNPTECSGAPTNGKKPKSENSSVGRHAKGDVKKEKLGERITALQQLVSPFGKTDTASVLHEALGYIRFLHDQVQVLSSPYLQPQPPNAPAENGEVSKSTENSKDDLRSRGLCLVPVDLTLHVADSNGADLWSSTAMADTVSSS
ncbi:hypothetical protein ACS0TY_001892 [Phlomoides rotata]